jgi:hypothetical protein
MRRGGRGGDGLSSAVGVPWWAEAGDNRESMYLNWSGSGSGSGSERG